MLKTTQFDEFYACNLLSNIYSLEENLPLLVF